MSLSLEIPPQIDSLDKILSSEQRRAQQQRPRGKHERRQATVDKHATECADAQLIAPIQHGRANAKQRREEKHVQHRSPWETLRATNTSLVSV